MQIIDNIAEYVVKEHKATIYSRKESFVVLKLNRFNMYVYKESTYLVIELEYNKRAFMGSLDFQLLTVRYIPFHISIDDITDLIDEEIDVFNRAVLVKEI